MAFHYNIYHIALLNCVLKCCFYPTSSNVYFKGLLVPQVFKKRKHTVE